MFVASRPAPGWRPAQRGARRADPRPARQGARRVSSRPQRQAPRRDAAQFSDDPGPTRTGPAAGRPGPAVLGRKRARDGDRRVSRERRSTSARAIIRTIDRMPGPPAPGPYLQTVSGRFVNPFDADPDQLDIADITRALANTCRFGGHCRSFYSVAQHSVIVSELVEQRGGDSEDVFAALMHDAAEAYLGDMPHPLKHRSALGEAFRAAEAHLEQAIHKRFGIKPDVPEIKRADRALLATERRVFSAEDWHWPELEGVEPLDLQLTAWSPDEAAARFAARYAQLDKARAS